MKKCKNCVSIGEKIQTTRFTRALYQLRVIKANSVLFDFHVIHNVLIILRKLKYHRSKAQHMRKMIGTLYFRKKTETENQHARTFPI